MNYTGKQNDFSFCCKKITFCTRLCVLIIGLLASASGTALKGTLLLLVYSMGLGVPFFIAAALLDKLNGALKFIKSHYKIINRVCGGFLIAVGVAMMFGLLNSVMSLFS